MACSSPADDPVGSREATPGLVVLYRWRVKPESERAFVAAWTRVTERLLEHGSLGSRLHRGSDGIWYAYAQWPSAEHRRRAIGAADHSPEHAADSATMKAATLESFSEVRLEPLADLLR